MLSLVATNTLQIQTVTNERFIQQQNKWSCRRTHTHTQLCKKCPQALKWVEYMINRWNWNSKDTKVSCCTSTVQLSNSLSEEAVDSSADCAYMLQNSLTGGSSSERPVQCQRDFLNWQERNFDDPSFFPRASCWTYSSWWTMLQFVRMLLNTPHNSEERRVEERMSECLTSSRYTDSSFPPPLVAPVSGAR